mmetsp:Transcript_35906/g.47240  ORF Transcript_35906/g.47240 Transcript_35906/m.47240 type:complete len:221 (+) Transcript_35906:332-994(+)
MQAKCAIEIYDAKPINWMQTEGVVFGSAWLKVELATFTGTILCNILFMFMRSLKEPCVRIELVDKKKQLPSVDSVDAMGIIMSQYLAFGVPCWVIYKQTEECYVPRLDVGHKSAITLGTAMFMRFILANILIWVNWKRGPQWWLKIAPTVMYLLSLFNYIIFPLGSMIWFMLKWDQMGKTVYGVYEKTVAIIWILQMLFYFRIIKPFIYANAMAYLAKRH